MAIVYRLEIKDAPFKDTEVNQGVYRTNTECDAHIGTACDGSFGDGYDLDNNNHPVPENDPKLCNHAIPQTYVFAFSAVAQLHTWFSNINNLELYLLDKIQIGVYFVPDEYYLNGTFQAVAHAEYMIRVDTWHPLRRG